MTALERIVTGSAAAHRCSATFEYFGATPPTTNDPAETEFVRGVIAQVLGSQNVVDVAQPAMWGEDFAFYLEQIPGCFYLLGVQPTDRDCYPMLHNALYDFTDAAILPGIRLMTHIAASKLV